MDGANKIVAEYSLRDIEKTIRISEYMLTKAIPEDFKSDLQSIEEIEEEPIKFFYEQNIFDP